MQIIRPLSGTGHLPPLRMVEALAPITVEATSPPTLATLELDPLLTCIDGEPTLELGSGPSAQPVVPLVRVLTEALVLPHLVQKHGSNLFLPSVSRASATLSGLLMAADPAPAFALVRRLFARAGSLAPLCATVLEPAARGLGDQWLADDCSQLELTTGLLRLHSILRELTAETTQARQGQPVVLVVPQPGERHSLASFLDAELLWAAGWDTHQEFPATDDALQALLSGAWFDVLDLSLSPAMPRDEWLSRMAETIVSARAASKNPALTVVASGRTFFDHGEACQTVGADASTASALHVVLTVTRALEATLTKTAELTRLVTSS